MTNLDSILKSRDNTLPTNVQSYGFSSSHVWMWELDHKEGWVMKNWCSWTAVLEKILESPLDCKEIKPVNPKGNQPWTFIGRTDAEAEGPILWPPDAKSWLIGKDTELGKMEDRRRRGWEQWDGWMSSQILWTWVWVVSKRWWRTEKAGVLQSMESQRVGQDLDMCFLLFFFSHSDMTKRLNKNKQKHIPRLGKVPEKSYPGLLVKILSCMKPFCKDWGMGGWFSFS